MKLQLGMALAIVLGASLPASAEPARQKAARKPEPKECIVLPGTSGVIEDRCKQIHLQCGREWHRRYCGSLIRPVF